MARLHIGTATTLAAAPAADCSNSDIAYIWLNGRTVKMVYDSTATNATDISDPPTTVYYIRPDDYGAAGVWTEDVGAEESLRLSMTQIRTGELVIDDNGSIHTDSKTSYADTDDGFFFGYDTDGYKVNFGGANSYVKWDGALAMKLASGETFDLLGSLSVAGGGDISLAVNSDIVFDTATGTADANRAIIQWNLDSYNVKLAGDFDSNAIIFVPSADESGQFHVGAIWGLGSDRRFERVSLKASNICIFDTYASGTLYGSQISCDSFPIGGPITNTGFAVIAQCGATYKAGFDGYTNEDDTEAYITMYGDLRVADDHYIGLGDAAGRIEFDDQATDEINFLDCNVGINDSSPKYRLDVNGTGRFTGAVELDSSLTLSNATLDTTTSYCNLSNSVIKTAGVTTEADDIFGFYNYAKLDHNGSTIGYLTGIYNHTVLADGTVGDNFEDFQGIYNRVQLTGGTAGEHVIGIASFVDCDTGVVTEDIIGSAIDVDIEAGVTSIGGNVIGMQIKMDADKNPTGATVMLSLEESTGIDYGIYQDGIAINRFGGNVGINAVPNSLLELGCATENLEFVDAGSAAATEQDWIEVEVGGNQGYIRVYAAK